jgi:hypothetical protein
MKHSARGRKSSTLDDQLNYKEAEYKMKEITNKSLLSAIGGGSTIGSGMVIPPVMGPGGLPPGWGGAEQVPLNGSIVSQLSVKTDQFSGANTPPSLPRSPVSISGLPKS